MLFFTNNGNAKDLVKQFNMSDTPSSLFRRFQMCPLDKIYHLLMKSQIKSQSGLLLACLTACNQFLTMTASQKFKSDDTLWQELQSTYMYVCMYNTTPHIVSQLQLQQRVSQFIVSVLSSCCGTKIYKL